MTGYKALALSILINGIIALLITLATGLELHEVLAGYAFFVGIINNINIRTIYTALKDSGEYK